MSLGLVAYASSSDDEDDSAGGSSALQPDVRIPSPHRNSKMATNFTEEEEDDEFLHKKVDQSLIERPKLVKGKVKITIPSLSSFREESGDRNRPANKQTDKLSGLIGMLPPPRSGISFVKTDDTDDPKGGSSKPNKATVTSLVPDTVRNRKAPTATKPSKASRQVAAVVDEDADEGSSGDFFGVFSEDKVPQISSDEVSDLVRKRAARMKAFEEPEQEASATSMQWEASETGFASPQQPSSEDMQQLIGHRGTKRKHQEDIQFIDISQDQLTSKAEWMAHSLQAETEYQPRGMTDDPASGTKKKHQITYLAHQAKANEHELQAMWSANRHAKMQTQNKYGF